MKFVRYSFLLLLTCFYLAAKGQAREEFGIAEQTELTRGVKLYPNPAVEYVNIKFVEPVAKQTKLTLHNIIGNVLEVEREAIDDYEVRLRVKDLPTGYYLLAIKEENSKNRNTLKFLKR